MAMRNKRTTINLLNRLRGDLPTVGVTVTSPTAFVGGTSANNTTRMRVGAAVNITDNLWPSVRGLAEGRITSPAESGATGRASPGVALRDSQPLLLPTMASGTRDFMTEEAGSTASLALFRWRSDGKCVNIDTSLIQLPLHNVIAGSAQVCAKFDPPPFANKILPAYRLDSTAKNAPRFEISRFAIFSTSLHLIEGTAYKLIYT